MRGRGSDGTGDQNPSFFQKYKSKLEKMYDKFYTRYGAEQAKQYQQHAIRYYEDLLSEIRDTCNVGHKVLEGYIKEH